MPSLLQRLEIELGPDTSELGIRVGLNSGQVTAGVLRADRARFQLFGDVSIVDERRLLVFHSFRTDRPPF